MASSSTQPGGFLFGDVAWATETVPSARERQVAELLATGLSLREVALRLGISYHTAHRHLSSLLHRMDARTAEEAVTRAIAYGYVHCPRAAAGYPCPLGYAGSVAPYP